MAKFMLLYVPTLSPEEHMANARPEDMQRMKESWMAWFGKNGSAIVDIGAPLHNGVSVTKDGSADSQTHVGCYTIIQADDMTAAKALIADHPHFVMPGGSIEILEMMSMPEM